MNQRNNSRRNFLGIMAILTSGSVVAGSPLCLLNDEAGAGSAVSLQQQWALFLAGHPTTSFNNSTGIKLPTGLLPLTGQRNVAGDVVHLVKENILAQPTWIYWGDHQQPDDIIISFFENKFPYKKIRNIDRYELAAIGKLAGAHEDKKMLQSLFVKSSHSGQPRLFINTRIKKYSKVQDIVMYHNNDIVLKDQLFYNV